MDKHQQNILNLSLTLQESLLPVVIQFVETAAAAFGLGKNECLSLGLATEEIFVHLCRQGSTGEPIEIQCRNSIYYARVRFRFSATSLNLRGLNITSAMTGDDEVSMDEMGLMIAARSVNRLRIIVEKQQNVCLVIEKEKDYPPIPYIPFYPPATLEEITIGIPDAEGLKGFALLAAQRRTDPLIPTFFSYPGKVADMVAGGEYQALVAVNPRQEIVGGILYFFPTDKIVHAIGPYTGHEVENEAIAEKLMDACLARVARTKAIGIASTTGLPNALQSHFDILGSRSYYGAGSEPIQQPCYYRLLHEDPGSVVWTHADLKGFLAGEYERLILAREIKTVRDFGETHSGASIFSAEIRRERLEAILRPLWPGGDFGANVERHIHLLSADHLANIFFELDLGISWHAALIPSLLTHSFRPEMILPFAGQADLVVFQYHAN
jgi:hypothetical protein